MIDAKSSPSTHSVTLSAAASRKPRIISAKCNCEPEIDCCDELLTFHNPQTMAFQETRRY
jgi:hypothetical protein